MPTDSLNPGTPRPFDAGDRDDLEFLVQTLADVEPQTADAWEDRFRQDAHPREEFERWKHAACILHQLTKVHRLGASERRECYRILTACRNGSRETVRERVRPQNLSDFVIQETLRRYFRPTANAESEDYLPARRVGFFGVCRASLGCEGATACVEVRCDGQIVIFDAGSGLRTLGASLAREFEGRPLHLDVLVSRADRAHLDGLTGFELARDPLKTIRILGSQSATATLAEVVAGVCDPAEFGGRVWVEEIEDPRDLRLGAFQLQTMFTNHPDVSLAFRLTTPAGAVVYVPEHEMYTRQEELRQAAEGQPDSTALAFAKQEDEKLAAFVRDASVLLCDGELNVAEYQARVGEGHSCLEDIVAVAASARVRRLFLYPRESGRAEELTEQLMEAGRRLAADLGVELEIAASLSGILVPLD